MKKTDITHCNIDDYIRESRRKARIAGKDRKYFRWSPEHWVILSDLVWVCSCDIFTGEGGIRLEEGGTFMGVRHYIKRK